MDCFIVRFIRIDQQPNEDYYYYLYKDARDHFLLFVDDCSGLYDRIELRTNKDKLLAVKTLGGVLYDASFDLLK